MDSVINKLSFAWWNTSLSPLAKSRSSEDDKKIAIAVIYRLLFELEIDFLALGETSTEDIVLLQSRDDFSCFRIVSGVSKVDRITFDTCFVYRPDRIQMDELIEIDTGKSGKKIKIAQKMAIKIGTDDMFHVFVSHWQSRQYCPENDPNRHLLGLRLRDEADDIYANSQSEPYIIFLGDFNDEPFDSSLSTQLMATRDKALAIKNKRLLYNPFWQRLSYQNLEALDYAGTYFDKRGPLSKWRTFDQIIVSSAFLKSMAWCLNETLTGIVNIPEYLTMVKNSKSIFDHLPIMVTFERNL
ncbi:MAG: hypothetical protein PHR16_09815 [Methylovulum sp.]|nr:hypothetical protein [Methylovulum sp.]